MTVRPIRTRSSFGMDHSIPRGVLKLFSDIRKNSKISFAEANEKSRKFYELLIETTAKKTESIDQQCSGGKER